MRRAMAVAATLAVAASWAVAATDSDVTGKWLTAEGKSIVEIYKQGTEFRGKLIWLKEPLVDGQPKKDTHNPDPDKRDRLLEGLEFIWGFTFAGGNAWTGGQIYDPECGKTYYGKIKLADGQLHLRGSLDRWGLAGRTTLWTRAPEKAEQK